MKAELLVDSYLINDDCSPIRFALYLGVAYDDAPDTVTLAADADSFAATDLALLEMALPWV